MKWISIRIMKTNKPKSRAVDNAALRARRKETGLVQWRPWVTPEEKASLILWLAVVRDNTPTKEVLLTLQKIE
ncbi:MAG: hypothetical protein ACI9N9_002599 [Enterobacterales bacterium]|jgi:hypothetical protein